MIKKKELNITARILFNFISSNLIPSHNKFILQHPKVALMGYIMDCKKLNLGAIIALKILTQDKQLQSSLPFSSLITALCKIVVVPFISKIDIEIISFHRNLEY